MVPMDDHFPAYQHSFGFNKVTLGLDDFPAIAYIFDEQ
jgi:hypothetical protein